jgi:hypothetical protein
MRQAMEHGEPTIIDDHVRLDGNGLSATPVDADFGREITTSSAGRAFSTVVDE